MGSSTYGTRGVTAPGILASVAGVNLSATALVSLFTVPTGKSCVITNVYVRNASAPVTIATTGFGFDINATNVFSPTGLNILSNSGVMTSVLTPTAARTVGTSGQTFGTKPTIAELGPVTVTIDVEGYLV